MKKYVLFACTAIAATMISMQSQGQSLWQYSGATEIVNIPATTGVGINTTGALSDHFSVNGNMGFQTSHASGALYREFNGRSDMGLAIRSNTDWTDGSGILLNSIDPTFGPSFDKGHIGFIANPPSGTDYAFSFINNSGGTWDRLMTITGNGNMSLSGSVFEYSKYGGNSVSWNRHLYGNTNTAFAIFSNDAWSTGAGIMLNGTNNSEPGSVTLVASGGTTPTETALNCVLWDQSLNGGTGGWSSRLYVNKGGDLTAAGNISLGGSAISYGRDGNNNSVTWDRHIFGNTSASFAMYANSGWADGAGIMLNGVNSNGVGGDIAIVAGNGNTGGEISFTRWNGNGWNTNMVIDKDGKVSIGSVPTPSGYRLYVQEGILTERVKVALSNDATNWSDFVFDDDYKLKSLDEVEDYIRENKHLPEIPSTKEVHKDGIDLAQMDAKLLQKVEELTLYVIDQNKKIEQQQKEIGNLKKQLDK